MNDGPIIFSIPRYEAYQRDLATRLGATIGQVERKQFPDGENYQRVVDDVEGRDVIVVGGTIDDQATLCLYDLASTVVTYGARRLSLVVPYFGYSTMERATKTGEAIIAKTRARLCQPFPEQPVAIESSCSIYTARESPIISRVDVRHSMSTQRNSSPR